MRRNIAPKNTEFAQFWNDLFILGTGYTIPKVVYVLFKKDSSNKVAAVVGTLLFRDTSSSSFPFASLYVCFCCCLLFYHAEFMTLFLILLGLKQNPGCRSNSGVKYSCDNPSTSTRHIVKCNQQADFSLFSAFFLAFFFHSDPKLEISCYFIL